MALHSHGFKVGCLRLVSEKTQSGVKAPQSKACCRGPGSGAGGSKKGERILLTRFIVIFRLWPFLTRFFTTALCARHHVCAKSAESRFKRSGL